MVFVGDLHRLRLVEVGRQWAFDGDGDLFRLSRCRGATDLASRGNFFVFFAGGFTSQTPSSFAAPHCGSSTKRCFSAAASVPVGRSPRGRQAITAGLLTANPCCAATWSCCLIPVPAANLAEQWQDRDGGQISTAVRRSRQTIQSSTTGSLFAEKHLAIGRIDLLKSDDLGQRLSAAEWGPRRRGRGPQK